MVLGRNAVRLPGHQQASWLHVLWAFGLVSLAVQATAATVLVDGTVRHQTMEGFGTSVRVFDDPHVFENFNPATGRAATVLTPAQQDQVLDRLYTDLRLTRVRPASPDTAVGSGIEPINDNNNPNVTDVTKFNFDWKRLDAHVDYIVRARERGANAFFLSPLSRETWMGTDSQSSRDVGEYSEWLLAQVRRSAERGVRLPYLSVANEPSYSRNTLSGEFMREVIKNLGPRLRAEGFDTQFVTTDDVRASNGGAKAQIILADPAARQYVGALATHLYDEPISNVSQMKSLAAQYELPLWMTEFTMSAMNTAGLPRDPFAWGSLMHDLIATYDVSAVDYLWGFFGEWEGNATTLISLNNTGATYDGYTLNKTYYTTGQFSRFIEVGAERIDATSSDAAVRTTAYLTDDTLTIVALNMGHSSVPLTIDLTGLPDTTQFQVVRTTVTENWASGQAVDISESTANTTLAGNSITTFIATLATYPGDFNQDGLVDAIDLASWKSSFGLAAGAKRRQGDSDGDGDVDGADFITWQQGSGIKASVVDAPVPEPNSLFSLLLPLVGAARARRINRGSLPRPTKLTQPGQFAAASFA
jgi:O-glycosyl hydrolase